jgi:serine/threonine-protein phosphatase 6 regulatory subunit 3
VRDRFTQQKKLQWDCFLVCFSVVAPETLENAETKWIADIKRLHPAASIYLVGCKIDLRENKDVLDMLKANNSAPISTEEGLERAKTVAARGYLECSALSQSGIREVFDHSIEAMILRSANNIQENSKTPENNGTTEPVDTPKQVPPDDLFRNLLEKKDTTIEQLMDETLRTELLKQFRLKNKKLLDLISKKESLDSLLNYVSGNKFSTQDERCAVELLTADVSSILDTLSSEESGLWDKVFEPFQQRPPVKSSNCVMNSVRVANFLMGNRNVEFLMYVKGKQGFLETVLQHIGLEPVVQLVVAMVEVEKQLEAMTRDMNWSQDLVPILTKKVTDITSNTLEADLVGILELFDILINKHPNSSVVQQFQSATFVTPIISNALMKESPIANLFMDILLRLVGQCVNTQQYETVHIPPLISEMLKMGMLDNNREISPLQKLYQLLYRPSTQLPPTITTSAGIVAPLGAFRLRCTKLILLLLKANYHVVDNALIEFKILARCIDLFFQFKWNNILHSTVEGIALYILESKPTFLCLHLLRDCSLVDRIIQAEQNVEQEKSMKSKREQHIPHLGYMGHLYVIANAVIASSKKHSAIFYYLDDVPQRGWRKFVEKLNQINAVANRQLGPTPPPVAKKNSQLKLSVD